MLPFGYESFVPIGDHKIHLSGNMEGSQTLTNTRVFANVPTLYIYFTSDSVISRFFFWTKLQQLSRWSFQSEMFSLNKSHYFLKVHFQSWQSLEAYFGRRCKFLI